MTDTAKTILIVEDEPPLAKALQLKLNSVGFVATVATDGQDALDILQDKEFDLILLDLIMPRVDGFSVLRWLHEHDKKTKVIILSNLGQTEDVVKAKKLGAVDYFVKADTPLVTIVERVHEHLAG